MAIAFYCEFWINLWETGLRLWSPFVCYLLQWTNGELATVENHRESLDSRLVFTERKHTEFVNRYL